MFAKRPVHIGLSARITHPEVGGVGLKGKTLQVLEQSVAQWAASRDTLVLMVPSVMQGGTLMRSNIRVRDYARYLDGLILQGGADVSPRAYGEEPLRPEWGGDSVRDAYELELVHEFMEEGKPILGICRGMQLINVALGGSLWQDLPSLCPGPVPHETTAYEQTPTRCALWKAGRWPAGLAGCRVGWWPPFTTRPCAAWAKGWWLRPWPTMAWWRPSAGAAAALCAACSGTPSFTTWASKRCWTAIRCWKRFWMPPARRDLDATGRSTA